MQDKSRDEVGDWDKQRQADTRWVMVGVCRNKENNQQEQTMPVNDKQRQPVPSWS